MEANLKRFAKQVWRKTGAYKLFASRANAFVLSFHRVKPPDGSLLDARLGAISPSALEQTLKLVMDLGFKFVSGDDFREIGDRNSKIVCLTFDDGLRDIADFALPVLSSLRIPATLFFITSTAHRQDLLWQHRIYAAIDRLSIEACLRCLLSLAPQLSLPADKSAIAGSLINTFSRQELQDVSHVLAKTAGISKAEERDISRKLYLTEDEVAYVERSGMALGGHGFEHWPASKLSETELNVDYQSCYRDLTGLSARKHFDFCVPFGDVANDCAGVAIRSGFSSVYVSEKFDSPVSGQSFPRYWANENLDDLAFILSRAFTKPVA